MGRRTLEALLRELDEAAGGPAPLPADLAGRVLRRARRRRAAKVSGLVVLALAAGGFAAAWREGPVGSVPPEVVADVPRDDVEPTVAIEAVAPSGADAAAVVGAATEAEISSHLAIAEHLLAREKQRRSVARAKALRARPGPRERLGREFEQTALVMVTQADRKLRKWDLKDSAANDYRRVIKLFPQTSWAVVARERLTAIEG